MKASTYSPLQFQFTESFGKIAQKKMKKIIVENDG